jgi:hypothetical protein
MSLVLIWIIFGLLIGSLGTYLLYTERGRNPEQGALLGAGVGAVGNLVALIPLWTYIYRQGQHPGGYIPEKERAPLDSRFFIRVALYAALVLLLLFYLLPVYTVISTSL